MKNQALRKRIEDAGLRYWQVADAIGISAPTFTIWLRHELHGEQLDRVQRAIEELTAGGVEDERKEAE